MKNKIKYFLLRLLGFFPESSNVDFYGGDYGKSLSVKLRNVAKLPKIIMVGDPLFEKTTLYRINQAAIEYGNGGISLNIFKLGESMNAAIIHLRNTFKYSVYKVWFSLPKGENCILSIATIGSDGLPEAMLFEYDCDKVNKATQSITKGYPSRKELKVNNLQEISYKKLESLNGLCAEVEFKPTETIFKLNGIVTNRSKLSVDNQQRLIIKFLPKAKGNVKVEKMAYIQKITVESKHNPTII